MLAHPEEYTQNLTPLNIIRSETVLSRYPIHRLAKRGNISIEIKRQNQDGEVTLQWEVSYNSRYGQPGPLAYKLDSLVVQRRIDEAERPLPQIICLGSLRDICEELGTQESGQNIAHVKRALRQNAFAAITAKVKYKGVDGNERVAEINDTRYGVAFTGEKLPDGRKADAVYIALHDFYREVLNNTSTRPLNYDYLKSLPPAPQRFYELISYQIYAALKHKRPRARYLYSDYCTYSPQTRYFDYEHVKKQMYKIHAPHRKSGYLASVELESVTDGEGKPDWIMFYTPGRKARAEHEAFNRKRQTPDTKVDENNKLYKVQVEVLPKTLHGQFLDPEANAEANAVSEIEDLILKLRGFGVSESKARELVTNGKEMVENQLSALPYRAVEKNQKNPAGWIVAAIENNYELPKAYTATLQREQGAKKAQELKSTRESCTLCDSSGLRYLNIEGRRGVKKCSHDPAEESKFPG